MPHWTRTRSAGTVPAGAALRADDARHRSADEALSKRDFIGLYVEEHARRIQDAPGLQVPPARGEHRLSWRNPQPDAFLSASRPAARRLSLCRLLPGAAAEAARAPGASRESSWSGWTPTRPAPWSAPGTP
jgi:hypothetical protein